MNIDGHLDSKIHSDCVRAIVHNHDIVAFSHTGGNHVSHVSGYQVISMVRPVDALYGGVAICVRSWLTRHVRVVRKHPHFGVMWIRIAVPECEPVFLAACYLPHEQSSYYKETPHSMKSHVDTLQADVAQFSRHGAVLICGDLNARIGKETDIADSGVADLRTGCATPVHTASTATMLERIPARRTCDKGKPNQLGKLVLDMCRTSQLVVLNGRLPGDNNVLGGGAFTFHGRGRSARSLIDYWIASPQLVFQGDGCARKRCRLFVAHPYSLTMETDHAYVSLIAPVLRGHSVRKGEHAGCIQYKYREEIAGVFSDAVSMRAGSLDRIRAEGMAAASALHVLQDVMRDALEETEVKCGQVIRSSQGWVASDRPQNKWYNDECRDARRSWKRACLNWGTTSVQAAAARRSYRSVTRRVKLAWEDTVAASLVRQWKRTPRQFWQSFRGRGHKAALTNVEDWADYFEDLYRAEDDQPITACMYGAPSPTVVEQADTLNLHISEGEVEAVLKTLQSHKAAGVDGIPPDFYKCAAPHIVPGLTALFNTFLTDKFPGELSVNALVPVPKGKGDPSVHDNYRGIAVGSAISKLFSMVLTARADAWAEAQGHRAMGQFGFRHGKSTIGAAFALRHVIDFHKLQCKPLYCAFIDFRKAYDSVDRETLWKCLTSMGIKGNFLRCIQEMYAEVGMQVRIGGNMSRSFRAWAGVKQGDPLSPLLFGLFIDCLEGFLNRKLGHTAGAHVTGKIVRVLLYADDLALTATSPEELQLLLDCLSEFCIDCGMKVNVRKSEVVCFNRCFAPDAIPAFYFQSHPLPTKQEFRYLGLKFDGSSHKHSCTWGAYAQQSQSAKQAMHAMWARCYELRIRNVRTVSHLFDALVRPIASYGCEVWGPDYLVNCVSKGLRSASEELHNAFMRQALGVRDSTPVCIMLAELGRQPMWMFWLCQCIRFWNHAVRLPDGDLLKSCVLQNWALALTSEQPKILWSYGFCESLVRLGIITAASDLAGLRNGTWSMKEIDMSHARGILQESLEKVWSDIGADNPRAVPDSDHSGFKLATYLAWFKPDGGLKREKAFISCVDDPRDIMNIARFRMGSHSLFVESLRWGKCRVPRSQRVCRCCDLGVLEDELHFLLECPLYACHRADLIQRMGACGGLDDIGFKGLVNCDTPHRWAALATYLRHCIAARNDVLKFLTEVC